MNESEQIIDLMKAFAKVQSELKPAVFNRRNPHFKSRYADFKSCLDACREPLQTHGLSFMQYTEKKDGELFLVTRLYHDSGQWIKSDYPLCPKSMDSQILGSTITYAKRYALCAMLGIVADEDANADDDGEAAEGRIERPKPATAQAKQSPPPSPKIDEGQAQHLKSLYGKLDDECKKKITVWLGKHEIYDLKDVCINMFPKVLSAIENAMKYMEQKKIEQEANV